VITEKAYAKINLTLNITGKRADGYHTLDTIMQTVSLYDTVFAVKRPDITVTCGRIPGRGNIACKAAEAFFAHTGLAGGAEIIIKKVIPVRGGFGGGSADAAAVLRGLNRLYKTGLSYRELREIAVSLGADVPFLIEGGTCLCTGIGDIIEPIKAFNITGSAAYCVCAAGIGASTVRMFREIDKHNISVSDSEKMLKSLAANDIFAIAANLHNDFMPVCRELFPEISALEKELADNGALGISLTGSGSGVFGMFDSYEKAEKAAESIRKHAFAKAAVPV